MELSVHVSSDKSVVTIGMCASFDIHIFQEFSQVYKGEVLPGAKYVIDMAKTEFIDSSGLGMLLLMRERLGGSDTNISILNCRPEIKRTLESVNLHSFIHIE